MGKIPCNIKTGWWSFELPVYRPHPKPSTYSLFSYEELPPIQEHLDDGFEWLKSHPMKERSLAEGRYCDGSIPDLGKLSGIIRQNDVQLPKSFITFIESVDLHKRIRSCTDCYLDVADRAVKTKGVCKGSLIHFLSDSQWCLHWYIHADHDSHLVAVSPNAYGFTLPDDDTAAPYNKNEIEIEHEEIWFCAPTFTDFIYRFWLENEIWFALAWDKQPLTMTQQAYVSHYVQPM
jgi:hypothetical protein